MSHTAAVSTVLLISALLSVISACSVARPQAALRRAPDCGAPPVQEYAQRVADLASFAFGETFTPPAKESATVMFWLLADGSLEKMAVVRSSSKQAHQHAILAARSAASFPPPPPAYLPCLVGRPLTLSLHVDRLPDCDQIPSVVTYSDSLHRRVLDHLDTKRREIGSERVLLELFLNSDGSLAKLSVLESPSPEATAKATAAVAAASPFAPPPEYSRCYAGLPYLLWLSVFTR